MDGGHRRLAPGAGWSGRAPSPERGRRKTGFSRHHWLLLWVSALCLGLGILFGRHLNDSGEATEALTRVYANHPHFEFIERTPHPTR
ncbi:MAG: hypothetical protein F8N37_05350 [Telmatospirillum sp.]|nr:hypothetical protein [Telmatospirillum sp.]